MGEVPFGMPGMRGLASQLQYVISWLSKTIKKNKKKKKKKKKNKINFKNK
jgi:hypothetical protein